VHAPLVLLYGYPALGTRFSIELHPNLRVIATLVDPVKPFNQLVTGNWPMSFPQALEAPIGSALLTYNIALLHRRILKCYCTSFAWAPLGPLVYVDERFRIVVVEAFVVFGS
jgi:hypothetical protein